MFIKLDQNNSGYIDYSGTYRIILEFVASTYNEERLEENEILDKAFNMIDTNHNGYLSR